MKKQKKRLPDALVVLEYNCPKCGHTQVSATNPKEVVEGRKTWLLCMCLDCGGGFDARVTFRC